MILFLVSCKYTMNVTLKSAIRFNQNNTYTGLSVKGYGRTYFTRKDFKKGEIVMLGFGKIIDHQTRRISVQIGRNKHYLPTKWIGRYWNHSCDSNTHVRSRSDGFPNLIASRDIKKGEEINYEYWMTEFAWIKNADELKVKCKCGTKRCKRKILPYSGLSKKQQEMLKKNKLCSKYLYTQP